MKGPGTSVPEDRSPWVLAIRVHPELQNALKYGEPIVALESAVITAGLPREPATRLSTHGLDPSQPTNLELARAMQRTVRDHGAVPATIAIIQGDLCIGLDDDEMTLLAEERCAQKASVTDLAAIMSTGGSAGTTVSATLAAIASIESEIASAKSRIEVFATGGIGGVHRNWQQHPDVSADLRHISITPVCVVCSGAKSILDLPATLETLEALGVPVLGFRTDRFPQFMCEGDPQLHVKRVDDVETSARICRQHWRALHQKSGVLLTNPVPEDFAIEHDEFESVIEQAERNATAHHISGSARTPFLLGEIAQLTSGRSLNANVALLLNNARLAAELAVRMHNS